MGEYWACRITRRRVTTRGHIIYEVLSSSSSNVNKIFVLKFFKLVFPRSGKAPPPYLKIQSK